MYTAVVGNIYKRYSPPFNRHHRSIDDCWR